jgi:NAD(P)-dependent dehydrogenase (short-subunit alcohol dehydrogenase family)
MGQLDGKVALVTGGASGLGAATARALRGAGATVVVADLDEAGGRAVADELGGRSLVCDVADLEANRAMVASCEEQEGGLDLVFLNAGIASHMGVGEDFDLARYRVLMGANLDGVLVGRVERVERDGQQAGQRRGRHDRPAAALAQRGQRGVGALAEVDGIRFNAVCPGFAESKIIEPIRDGLAQHGVPIIPAEQVAETVLTLMTGEMSGECWFVQAGRESAAFGFRGIPGPRA